MDHAAKGAAALEAKQFSAAVGHYTDAIHINHQAVDYYIKRSTAYTRVSPPEHALAFNDAEIALALAYKRAKRELIVQSQLRRGVALFGLQRWADSKQCFDWVKKLDEKEKTVAIWQMKVDGKLKNLQERDEAGKVTVEEIPKVQLPKAAGSTVESKPGQPKNGASNNPTEQAAASPAQAKIEGVQTPASKIRHEWYQTSDSVVVTLFAKGVPQNKATIDIQKRSLAISFPLPTGSDFDFSLDPLFAAIDPSASTSKVMATKVECVLKKADPGIKWATVESAEPVQEANPQSEDSHAEVKQALLERPSGNAAPSYPTSSKSGPKDWDKLADDLTKKKPKKEKSEENGEEGEDDGVDDYEGNPENAFLQTIFKGSNPDAQRAMMKSYQESNGTVLSTDWSEVSKKKVETAPPDGMVAKKWGE